MITVDEFSRMVRTIYDAVGEPGGWAVALEGVSAAMGATLCAVVSTDRGRNEIAFMSAGADPASVTAYNDYYGAVDHVPAALGCEAAGTVVALEQLVPHSVVARSEIYNDWANPSECGDGVFALLGRHGDERSWLFAAGRAKPKPFASAERVALARMLVPHLQHAIRTQGRLTELDCHYRDFASAIDLLPDGIAIVGLGGRVVHLNPAAAVMLAGEDGLSVRSGVLAATVSRVGGVLDHVVHQALARGRQAVSNGGCVAVPRQSGLRPYLVRVIALGFGDAGDEVARSAMVIIVDPEREPEPEVDALRRLYGLTRSEAEVARRVLAGTGLQPIAEELTMSVSTVRTHLQHVFDKTQTHRQAELVRLLLGGLAATRHPGTT